MVCLQSKHGIIVIAGAIRESSLQQPLTAYVGAPLAQGRHSAAVCAVQIRIYTRCRQRVLGLYVDATFAGFRRTFGALQGSGATNYVRGANAA